jgi:multiple sugar transport system substrate-binding protein
MAEEITLSVMQQLVGDVEEFLRPILEAFEAETHIHVNLQVLNWSDGMDRLLQTALHGEGPDVSEIGTTWVSSFVAMNSLQPFLPTDLHIIGIESEFLPAPWNTCKIEGGDQMWAMPWMVGMRVLFYRRDLFEKAGVDPLSAFDSHNQIYQTMELLQENGVASPWAVPTLPTLNTLHYIANWIWSAGGDFVSPDGQEVLFDRPESLNGITKYYRLGRFLPQPADKLDPDRVSELFWKEGKTAALIGGPWQLPAYEKIALPEVWQNLGIAPLPGIAFLGGSNLIVWEHVRNKMAAVRLIGFLTSDQVQKVYPPHVGLYPVRRETLTAPKFTQDPVYGELVARFETGQAYPAVSLWGVIERRLPQTLSGIWQAYLKDPKTNLDELVKTHIDQLAKRLAITLRR